MKFECDSCHAQYMIADEKVGKRGVKVKCKKCQHVIIVRPDGQKEAAAAADLPKLEPAVPAVPAVPAAAAAAPAVAPKMEPVEAKRKGEKTGERSSSKSSVKKAKEKAIELPVPTIAAPPPPGLETLNSPRDDDAGAFAAGAATDPSAPAMRGAALDDGLPPHARGVPAPPPAEEPETTGPNMVRPAPISMFQDQTQLTQNPMGNIGSETGGRKADDRTELGAPVNMTANGNANANEPQDNGATQVTKTPLRDAMRNDPLGNLDDVPAPPPAPPPMATAEGAPPMGHPDDALGDQLSGAFNAMFDAAPAGGALADPSGEGDHRGPTRVLDASAVDALRKQSGLPAGLPSGIKVDNTIRGEDHGLGDEGFVMKPTAGADGADDGPPDQVWHVAIDDQDVGPLSLAEVGRHIEGGRVDRESLVWKIGMDDWLPAGDVPSVRALFDKVPMPRIARVDDEPRNGKSKNADASFGGGPPSVDDSAPVSGNSPFDESGDESWRPHGLTDVYQAANLAEAAGAGMGGGMGGSLGAASFGMSASTSSSSSSSSSSSKSSPSGGGGLGTSSEPEWRPAAASALSALVNDEIKRIDNGPLPASDDGLSPADDASIDAPIFGSMGGASARGGIDAGPELSDPVAPPRAGGAAFDGRAAPQFGAQSPQGGFMSTPPQQRGGLSPALIAGIAGGGALFLVLVILVVVLATRGGDKEPETKIVMIEGKAFLQGPDGKFTPLAPSEKEPPKDATPPKDASQPATQPTTPPADQLAANGTPGSGGTTPPGTAVDKPVTENPGQVAVIDKPAADPIKKSVKKADRDPPPKKDEPVKPPPKGDDKPTKNGDCDPVLDFDCKGGKPSSSSNAAKEPPKETLSKADVLVVVKANMGKVEGCGRKNKVGGVIKMSWKIQPSGKVSEVSVADSKFAGTPVGGCVTNEIKNWKFPASKASTPVSFPMKLGS